MKKKYPNRNEGTIIHESNMHSLALEIALNIGKLSVLKGEDKQKIEQIINFLTIRSNRIVAAHNALNK